MEKWSPANSWIQTEPNAPDAETRSAPGNRTPAKGTGGIFFHLSGAREEGLKSILMQYDKVITENNKKRNRNHRPES
jgi:hypothetical protein